MPEVAASISQSWSKLHSLCFARSKELAALRLSLRNLSASYSETFASLLSIRCQAAADNSTTKYIQDGAKHQQSAEFRELVCGLRERPDVLLEIMNRHDGIHKSCRSLYTSSFVPLDSDIISSVWSGLVRQHAQSDVPVDNLFAEPSPALIDTFSHLWGTFGGRRFLHLALHDLLLSIIGPHDLHLDLNLLAVVQSIDAEAGIYLPRLTPCSSDIVDGNMSDDDAPAGNRYCYLMRNASWEDTNAAPNGRSRDDSRQGIRAHVGSRTRTIRRRLQDRSQLCVDIAQQLIHRIRMSIGGLAEPAKWLLRTIALETHKARPELADQLIDRIVCRFFIDRVLLPALEDPSRHLRVPFYLLDEVARANLRMISSFLRCLGSAEQMSGCASDVLNEFLDNNPDVLAQVLSLHVLDRRRPMPSQKLVLGGGISAAALRSPSPSFDACVCISASNLRRLYAAVCELAHDGKAVGPRLTALIQKKGDVPFLGEEQDEVPSHPDVSVVPIEMSTRARKTVFKEDARWVCDLFECLSLIDPALVRSCKADVSLEEYLCACLSRIEIESSSARSTRHQSLVQSQMRLHMLLMELRRNPKDWSSVFSHLLEHDIPSKIGQLRDRSAAAEARSEALGILLELAKEQREAIQQLKHDYRVDDFIRSTTFSFQIAVQDADRSSRAPLAGGVARRLMPCLRRRSIEPGTALIEIPCTNIGQIVSDLYGFAQTNSDLSDVVPLLVDAVLKRVRASLKCDSSDWIRTDTCKHIHRHLLLRLFPVIFSSEALAQEDEALTKQMQAFSWVTLAHLDLPPGAALESALNVAVRELQRLNMFIDAADKVACIVQCIRITIDALKLASRASNPVGADDLMPALTHVILRARPAQLKSNVVYCRRFWRASEQGCTEDGAYKYCMTQFSSAVEFVHGLDGHSLSRGHSLACSRSEPEAEAA